MKIIEQSAEIMTPINQDEILKHLEQCVRVCYKSENRITETSAPEFIRRIIQSGHEAAIEHFSITVKFITDRATANEITRHRIASYCQESTRYCNYCSDKFENEITVVLPVFQGNGKTRDEKNAAQSVMYNLWEESCLKSEKTYFEMVNGLLATPQEARSVLPLSLKTELVMTANIREWRYFLKLRGNKKAHPQLVKLTRMLHKNLVEKADVLFGDIDFSEV